MEYLIQISRRWECAHRGAPPVAFEAGTYRVPEDMAPVLARRCIESGIGRRLTEETDEKPRRKSKRGPGRSKRAPENASRGGAPENAGVA